MNTTEILIAAVLATVVLLPVFHSVCARRFAAVGWTLSCLLLLTVTMALLSPAAAPPLREVAADRPVEVDSHGYVGSSACRSCHPRAFDTWHDSWHRTMTQRATPETVIPDFDNVVLESRARRYLLQREGSEFYAVMADPDWEFSAYRSGIDLARVDDPPVVRRRIVMTTGSHHMQGFWVTSPTGNLVRQLPWYYLIDEQKWIPREDAFLAPPDDPRHFQTWNDRCIHCHSTNPEPRHNRTPKKWRPDTTVAEFGISCEACHGPGEEHVRKYSNPLARYLQHGSGKPDSTIVNPARLPHDRASEICGRCHGSSRVKDPLHQNDGVPWRPGEPLARIAEPVNYADDLPPEQQGRFWRDGTCRTGGDEFNGLSESACFLQGELSCLTCHSMHQAAGDSRPPKEWANDQLRPVALDNRICLNCHDQYASDDALTAHTHHSLDSAGSQCMNCHMPYTSYALLTAMRSHRIDSPGAGIEASTGRPNACNLCHLDRSLGWTADRLTDWYGQPQPDLKDVQRQTAASLLWLYRGDAAQRVIAAWSFGWKPARDASGEGWLAPHLASLLDDDYAAIRFVAARSMASQPGFDDFTYDFLASPATRSRSVQQAVDRWTARWDRSQEASARVPLEQLLLTPEGRVRHDEVSRLLEQRDRTPLRIPE